jgi:hypothetical protein
LQDEFITFDIKKNATGEDFDLKLEESFPELAVSEGVHIRGKKGLDNHHKKRHGNKNKKEKVRRLYSDSTSYA